MPEVPIVGGLWLRHYPPDEIGDALASILSEAEGFFIFSTYSLWEPDPAKRVDAWALQGSQADYWQALRDAMHD